jgi:4-amino-4-deoxy-L-arabinose transferase-like glycosyltransferase
VSRRSELGWLAAVLGVGLVLRVGVCVARPDLLAADPDGYVWIAEQLRAGAGFVHPDGAEPSAYRPPLYPVLLVPFLAVFGRVVGVAVLNVLCGLGTVVATWWLGRRLGLGRGAIVGAGIVAVDPLLVLYTSHPMTEVPFTLLTTLLLLAIHEARSSGGWTWSAGVGAVFALAALCRPTIWAFGGLAIVVAGVGGFRGATSRLRRGAVLAALVLGVTPWVVRNQVVLGRPVVMTTHGGYTLLLANNPVFDAEVVRQPWGTTWGRESLARWQASLEAELAASDPPIVGELARDRWLRDRAIANITRDPAAFGRGTWFRVLRFWNPQPVVSSLPLAVVRAVGSFNVLILVAAFVGCVRLRPGERSIWWPGLLLIVSLTAVHAVYWSNARMRAPLVPVLALLAVRAGTSRSAGEVEAGGDVER